MNADQFTLAEERTKSYDLSNALNNVELKPLIADGKFKPSHFNLGELKEIMMFFHQVTGLGVGLFNDKNETLENVGLQKICAHFHKKSNEAYKSCKESESFFRNNFTPNKAISHKCNNGLWDVAFPLYNNGQLVGSLRFGQFFYHNDNIDKSFFIHQAEKYGFDQDAYIEQLKQVPILEENKVISSITLFLKFISMLNR